jgi:hypothetical protein
MRIKQSENNVINWTTPNDDDLIRELRLCEIYRKHGLTRDYQSLLNVCMQAMTSRDRDQRVRDSLVCVSFN